MLKWQALVHREVNLQASGRMSLACFYCFAASKSRVAGVARLRAADSKDLNSGELVALFNSQMLK